MKDVPRPRVILPLLNPNLVAGYQQPRMDTVHQSCCRGYGPQALPLVVLEFSLLCTETLTHALDCGELYD